MSATFTLILETSTPRASLATVAPDGWVTLREFTSDRSHNAVLFSPLQELLLARQDERAGLVLVGGGPGSYSGTRVGIAAAQGVAIASGCPAVAVPSVLAVPSAEAGALCLAIGDARRGSFWTWRIGNPDPADEPELTNSAGLERHIEDALGNGVVVFSFEDPSGLPLPPELRDQVRHEFPDAGRLWQAWKSATAEIRAGWQARPAQPIYLKPPHITPAKRPWLAQPQP